MGRVRTVAASRGGLDGARPAPSSLSLRLPMFVVVAAGGLLVGDVDRIGAMLMLVGDLLCSYFGAPVRRGTVSVGGTGIASNGRLREWSKWRRRDERIEVGCGGGLAGEWEVEEEEDEGRG